MESKKIFTVLLVNQSTILASHVCGFCDLIGRKTKIQTEKQLGLDGLHAPDGRREPHTIPARLFYV
jgi:hypothetical protein